MSELRDLSRLPSPVPAGVERIRASVAGVAGKGALWVVAVSVLQLTSVLTGVLILQPVTALLFATTCPGLVVLDLETEIPDLSARLLAGLAASIGINVVVVSVLLVAGMWSASLSTVVIALLSFAAAAVTRRHVASRGSGSAERSPAW